jgi:hypothetical protein
MTNEEKVLMLLGKESGEIVDNREVSDNEPDGIPDDDPDTDISQLPGLETYRQIVKQTRAYHWLLWRIIIADEQQCPGPFKAQEAIQECVLKGLSLPKQFSRVKSPRVSVEYRILWDPFAFHYEQQYSCTVEQMLEQAVTITGHLNDIQATTCIRYVDQTWGELGVRVLEVLQQTIRDLDSLSPRNPPNTNLPLCGELSISAQFRDGTSILIVSASGLPHSVAEVGEVLAWITSALRCSPNEYGPVSCRPVASFGKGKPAHTFHTQTDEAVPNGICGIETQFQPLGQSGSSDAPGNCWPDAFRNPVVVGGFPIPRRSLAGSGLEISIDILISLTTANYLVNFCQRTFLKGFSTMLAVTKVVGSTVFWHFFYNKDKAYISYEDARVPNIHESDGPLTVNEAILTTSRHIVGWCEKVSCLAGTSWHPSTLIQGGRPSVNSCFTAGTFQSRGVQVQL